MKTSSIAITLLTIVFALSGCASSENTTRSQETVNSLNQVGEHLNNVLKQLNNTESSLANVSNASESGLEDAYDNFSSNVSNLSQMREELGNRLQQMQSTSNDYLSQWRKEADSYNNSELRNQSEERRQELSETFSDLMNEGGNVNRALETFISDMREVESYLSNDLTTQGAQSATSSQEYEQSADDVREEIEQMQQSLAEARRNMGGGSPLSE